MNRATLKAQAADFAGDPNYTRYTETKYNDAANRAQEQFATDTRALFKDMTPVTTTADDAEYDLPSDFIVEDWVTYDGDELIPASQHDIQKAYGSGWDSLEGTPTHVLINPEEAQKSILLVPIPQEAKTLAMRYFCFPAAMDDDADTPLNGSTLMVQFHLGLAAFMAWLLMTNEEPTPAIIEKRRELLRIYNDAVNKAIETFKNTASAPIQFKGGRVWR
jgi:hypothetical protein